MFFLLGLSPNVNKFDIKRPKKWNYFVEIFFINKIICPPHNIILFELDFKVKFSLLRLIQFLGDSKINIVNCKKKDISTYFHTPITFILSQTWKKCEHYEQNVAWDLQKGYWLKQKKKNFPLRLSKEKYNFLNLFLA